MKKLIVIIGDSGSGKTTLVNELTRKYPDEFKKVVTCTSRTPRMGEIDGEDYHFLLKKHFNNNSDLVLVKNPFHGDCYGTRKSELYSETHHLLLASKPSGVLKLIQLGFLNIVAVRININEKLKIERMRQRGDSEEEILQRLLLDRNTVKVDFNDIPVVEIEADQSLDRKVELVFQAC